MSDDAKSGYVGNAEWYVNNHASSPSPTAVVWALLAVADQLKRIADAMQPPPRPWSSQDD